MPRNIVVTPSACIPVEQRREAAKIANEWLGDMPKVTAFMLDQAVSLY